MITGFNPTDMYGVDHIRRVLQVFPGVFSGIGEFTIHKEFVSSKVAGDTASLTDPALDRILDFAAEVGLVALIHNDIDTPFAKQETKPAYLEQMLGLLRRHPKTTIIWAHTGLAPRNSARQRSARFWRQFSRGRSSNTFTSTFHGIRRPGTYWRILFHKLYRPI